ncbi:Uncharacterized protein DAT39_022936, partial [Clarias magur]
MLLDVSALLDVEEGSSSNTFFHSCKHLSSEGVFLDRDSGTSRRSEPRLGLRKGLDRPSSCICADIVSCYISSARLLSGVTMETREAPDVVEHSF